MQATGLSTIDRAPDRSVGHSQLDHHRLLPGEPRENRWSDSWRSIVAVVCRDRPVIFSSAARPSPRLNVKAGFGEEMAINELQCSTLKQGAFLCWLRKATNRDKDQTYEDNGDSYACSLK